LLDKGLVVGKDGFWDN